MTPSYPTATRTRSQGMVFLFRWPCYQIQVNTPVDVWSNHACQVAFSSVSTARSGECQHSFLPGLKKMHPSATRRAREQAASCSKYVNQQAASWSKVGSSRSVPMVLLSLDFGQEMHSTYLDKARVRAVGPSWSHRATIREFRDTVGKTCRTTQKSKDKGKRPNQGRIAKRITPPEETSQRPLEHQARRRSRKETLSQVAQNGRLSSTKTLVDEDSQESPTVKTCSSYEKKPARIQKYQKNRDSF